jgi:hypothetical protein
MTASENPSELVLELLDIIAPPVRGGDSGCKLCGGFARMRRFATKAAKTIFVGGTTFARRLVFGNSPVTLRACAKIRLKFASVTRPAGVDTDELQPIGIIEPFTQILDLVWNIVPALTVCWASDMEAAPLLPH